MKKVLVLDDDMVAMLLYSEIFKREPDKYSVIKCFNGLEAIKRMKNDKPDVVILDIHMPLVNGLEVYEKIKATEEINNIPIIVATADVSAKNKYNKKLSGVTWMLKPIISSKLFRMVDKACVKNHISV